MAEQQRKKEKERETKRTVTLSIKNIDILSRYSNKYILTSEDGRRREEEGEEGEGVRVDILQQR